jgi:hypothetical protein
MCNIFPTTSQHLDNLQDEIELETLLTNYLPQVEVEAEAQPQTSQLWHSKGLVFWCYKGHKGERH